jgi:class 3 adenylate cyclase
MPLPKQHKTMSLEACLRNWTAYSGQLDHRPVFFPFLPTEPSLRQKTFIPKSFADGRHRPLIRKFWSGIGTRVLNRGLSFSLVDLPGEAANTLFTTSQAYGLFCLPGKVPGYAAFLVSDAPTLPTGSLFLFLRAYLVFLLTFWIILGTFLLCGGRTPDLGVRTELLLWLTGIVLTPLALTLGAGNHLLLNVSSNSEDQLKQDLARIIGAIDTDSKATGHFTLTRCRDLVKSKEFRDLLEGVSPASPNSSLADLAWNKLHQEGLELSTFMLFGEGDISITRIHPSIAPDTAEISISAHRYVSRKYFPSDPAFPKAGTETSAKSKDTRSLLLDAIEHNDQFVQAPGTLSHFRMGEKHSDRFFDVLTGADGRVFCLYLSWTLDRLHQQYLEKAIPQIRERFPEYSLTALHQQPGVSLPIAASGDPTQLRQLIAGLQNATFFSRTPTALFLGRPSREMPGFLVGASVSLAPLRGFLQRENWFIAGGVAGILLLVVLVGISLSNWIAAPIIRLTQGLRGVAANRLDTRFAEPRGDEVGKVSRTLDQMVRWLEERNAMSRFVSPQVLDAVAAGDSHNLSRGTLRTVTLLVCDIRNFTTMSEAHSPHQVFSLLNTHLNIMTPIIHQHGGTIDRFIGDAIQAVFYPGSSADSMQIRALRAAAAMMTALAEINSVRRGQRLFTYEIGIGLESGEVVTGVLGAPEVRLDYSILGESFRQAAELESRSKKGRQTRIICSEQIVHSVRGRFSFSLLGDDHPVPAWELDDQPSISHSSYLPGGTVPAHENQPGPNAALQQDQTTSPDPVAPGKSGPDSVPDPSPSPNPSPSPTREGRTEGSPHQRSTPFPVGTGIAAVPGRHRWFPLLAFLLPIGILSLFFHFWHAENLAHKRRQVERRLDESTRLLSNIPTGDTHVALALHAKLAGMAKAAAAGPQTGKHLAETVEQAIATLSPHLSYRIFRHRHDPDHEKARSSAATEMVRSVGDFPGISPDDLRLMFTFFKMKNVQSSISDVGEANRRRRTINAFFHTASFYALMDQSWGNFTEVQLAGESRRFMWFPLYHPAWEPVHHDTDFQGKGFSKKLSHLQHFLGGVFFLTTREGFPEKIFRDCFLANLGHLGLEGMILSESGCSGSPGFSHNPLLRQAGKDFSASGTIPSIPGWVFTRFPLSWLENSSVLLAQVVPGSDWMGINPWLYWVTFLGILLLLFWYLVRPLGSESRIPGFPLFFQLTGAFCLISFSAVLFGWLSLERSRLEESTRRQSDHRKFLRETLDSVAAGRSLQVAYADAIIDGLFADGRRGEHLRRLELQRPKRQTRSVFTSWFQNFLLQRGIRFTSAYFMGPKTVSSALVRSRDTRDAVQQLFQSFSNKTLRALNSDLGGKEKPLSGKDLSLEVFLEEGKNLFLSAISPDDLTEVFLAPHASYHLAGFDGHLFLSRKFLSWQGKPRYSLFTRLKPESTDFQTYRYWHRRLRQMPSPRITLTLAATTAPFQYNPPPYYGYSLQTDQFINLDLLTDSDLPRRGFERFIARESGLEFFGESLERPNQVIEIMHPSKWGDFSLTGEMNLTMEQADVASRVLQQRLVLAGLILLTIILSFLVSRRFLTPMAALNEAAQRIMKRDFSVRVVPVYQGEFQELVTAFNQVARGVAEGKLLSRFVSESVRTAARSQELEQTAREGRQIEAVILFCGIAGFSPLLNRLPPDVLVEHLNRYLEQMARIIRNHGGDIDKFIGDKILAVFHPPSPEMLHESAASAADAAEAMRQAMRNLPFWSDFAIEIGMVGGPVLAGIMGAEGVRREFTVIGDTVNLASRLCDQAGKLTVSPDRHTPGGCILLTAETSRLLATSAAANRLEPAVIPPIKGKCRSVEVFFLNPPPASG